MYPRGRKEGERSRELVKRKNSWELSKPGEEPDLQVHETNRKPNNINAKRPSLRYIIVKLAIANDKEKILREARQKKITYKGTPIRLSAYFLAETLQARKEWNDILKTLKGKNFQPRILYPVKWSLWYNGEIKVFADKQSLREFIVTRCPIQAMIKNAIIPETNRRQMSTKLWTKR